MRPLRQQTRGAARLAGTLLLALLLAGCAQSVSREELLQRIQARAQLPDSHYDMLWYQGSRGDTHYFKHIRGYFLDEARFRVDASELPITEPRAYSWNSDHWMQVERIGQRWHYARRDSAQHWQPHSCSSSATWGCLRLD